MPTKKTRQSNRQHRPKRRRRRQSQKQKTPPLVRVGLIVFFAVAFGMLVQQAVIIGLDRDVSNLQSEVKEQQAVNDSKEGRIISGRNLDKIEAKARAYGMTEPTAKQYQYVVVKPQSSNTSPLYTFRARIRAFVNQIKNSGDKHDKKSGKTSKNAKSAK